jgi:hypothetical protein
MMNVFHNPPLMRIMGWNFGIVACGRDLHGNNFTGRIPNFQMEFLQHL